jgi:hypothetical protein
MYIARWRRWSRHCATRHKVEGSLPDGVIGIDIILSACSVALESTQTLTEMSTSNISWVVKAAVA